MTKSELKKSVEKNLDYVKEYYKKNQFFSTMLVIDSLKGKTQRGMVVVMGNEAAMDNRTKVVFDLGIRTAIEKFRGDIDSIEAIFMMSEVWTSAPVKKGETYTYGRPSLDPQRKEAIISTGLSKDGQNAFSIFEMKRSLNLKDDTMNIEFIPFSSIEKEEKKVDSIEVESPLLKRFWDGVELMEMMFKEMPKELEDHAKSLSVDSFLNMIIRQIDEVKNKKHDL